MYPADDFLNSFTGVALFNFISIFSRLNKTLYTISAQYLNFEPSSVKKHV